MNEIVNKFLLAGDKFMPEIHLKQLEFTDSACGLKTKKEFKNLRKQEMQTIFTKLNLIKLVFNMTWHMKILKIYQEKQVLRDKGSDTGSKVLRDKAFNIAKS